MQTVYISIGLSIIVLALLLRVGLVRLLPWFGASLLTRIIPGIYLLIHSEDPNSYYSVWFVGEIALLVTLGLTGLEIYFLITRAIYRLGWIGSTVLCAAFLLAALVAWNTGSGASDQWNARVASLLEAKRLLLTFLTAGLAAVFWFYRRFEIPVASFVWPHAFIFLFYVASHAAGFWVIEAWGGRHLEGLNILLGVLWAACLLAWSWVFSKQPVWPSMPTEAELAEADRRAERLTRLVDQ